MGRRKCLCPRRSMATVDTNLHTARPCKGCSASLHSTARRCHPGTCVCPTDSRSAHCTPVPACRRCTHRRRRSSRRRRRPVRAGNLELRRTNRSYSCHRRRTHPMGGQLGHTNMCPGFVPRHRCTRPRHHRRGARSSAERHTPEHRHPVSQGDMSDTSVPECIHWKSSKTLLRCRLCCRGPGNTQYPRHTRRRCRRTGRLFNREDFTHRAIPTRAGCSRAVVLGATTRHHRDLAHRQPLTIRASQARAAADEWQAHSSRDLRRSSADCSLCRGTAS